MIKSWEELSDELAEMKIDIYTLQNSLHSHNGDRQEPEPILEREPTSRELQNIVHKTQVLVNDLMDRINKHIDASKKKPTTKAPF